MKTKDKSEFDQYAANYDEALNMGLSVSGERKEYFAEKRIEWLKKRLRSTELSVTSILDYGCGAGGSIPYLCHAFSPEYILGIDISEESVSVAKRKFSSEKIHFSILDNHSPKASFDLAFSNGVFHHIPPPKRLECLKYIYASLKAGGAFAIWENNPWNPGTRFIMNRVPFDRDAITLNVFETRNLLRQAGFALEPTDFLFIFPKALSWLRPLESCLSSFPIGGQYLTIGIKPKV